MPLTIGATPFAQWACLQELMQHLGWDSAQPVQSGAQLGAGAEKGPWLLLHTRPEYAVAYALDQGQNPEQALQRWQTEAQQMLTFFRAHRRQAAMVDLRAASRHPGELLEWLAQNHDAFFDLAKPYSRTLTQPEPPSELNLLLATQLVSQTSELLPLLAHLEAGGVPLGEARYEAPTIDINGVSERLTSAATAARDSELKQENGAKIRAEALEKDLKEENDMILKQLFQVQEELEKYYLESKDQGKRLRAQDAELKKLQKRAIKLQTEISALKKDKRLLISSVERLKAQGQGFKVKRMAAPLKGLSRTSRRLRQNAQLIRASELFDEAWYLTQNPDVQAQAIDPALHYVKYGGIEGRAASPQFDSASYLKKNPDVAEQGFNPLVHYLLHGKAEGRKT